MLNIAVELGRAGKTAQFIWFQLNISLPVWTIFLYFIFICCQVLLGQLGLFLRILTHTIYIFNKWKILNFPLILFYCFILLTHWLAQLFPAKLSLALSLPRRYCFFWLKLVTARHVRALKFLIPWGKSMRIYGFGPCLIMLSEIHWWWLFKVNRHAPNPAWTHSELIKPTLITCSETENPELLLNPELWVNQLRAQD